MIAYFFYMIGEILSHERWFGILFITLILLVYLVFINMKQCVQSQDIVCSSANGSSYAVFKCKKQKLWITMNKEILNGL